MKNKKQPKKHRNKKFSLRNFSKKQKYIRLEVKKGKNLKNAKSNVKIFQSEKSKPKKKKVQIGKKNTKKPLK